MTAKVDDVLGAIPAEEMLKEKAYDEGGKGAWPSISSANHSWARSSNFEVSFLAFILQVLGSIAHSTVKWPKSIMFSSQGTHIYWTVLFLRMIKLGLLSF